MCRFTFYFLVALLTFGIGSFIAFKFYWKAASDFPIINEMKISSQTYPNTKPLEQPWKFSAEQVQEKKIPTKPFCKDDKILPIWNQLLKDKNFQDWERISDESLDCADMLEIKEIDLNQDNQKEILLRGKNFYLCSAVGNCAFWIYEKKSKRYEKALYSTDYIDITEMGEQIKKTRTNNYSDILLKGHLTAADTSYDFYKFDGKRYKRKKCLVNTYVRGTSDNPQWEFVGCKEFYKRWENER